MLVNFFYLELSIQIIQETSPKRETSRNFSDGVLGLVSEVLQARLVLNQTEVVAEAHLWVNDVHLRVPNQKALLETGRAVEATNRANLMN